MKKMFSLVMVLAVLVTVLGFNVGTASAKAWTPPSSVPVVVLSSPYFNSLEEGTVIEASVEGMTMYCRANSNHTLKCVVPKTFAGQNVTIKISIDGTRMNFPVKVPDVQEHIFS